VFRQVFVLAANRDPAPACTGILATSSAGERCALAHVRGESGTELPGSA
jgi:hypothetical protein